MKRFVLAGLRQEFSVFLMQVFRELHPGTPPLELAWYLKAICHSLVTACDKPGSRLVITVPPRHLKSVAASVALPAFLLGRDPTRRVMVATYSQDLARLHASQCRAIMQTDWYRALFPAVQIADDGNRQLELVTTVGGGRKAVSVGGSVTGFGADIIIVDDCLKADDARSEAKRSEAKNWFDGTLATRLNHAGGGAIISISQRLHEDDLPAHLLDKGYDHLCLPAIAEKEEWVPIGRGVFHHREVGSLLGRPNHTRETLEAERRNLGPQVFSAQFQQNPIAPEGNLVRMEWFPRFDEILERGAYYRVVQSWDTAASELPGADYSVCTTWGFREKHWDLIHVLRERLAYPDLKRAVLRQRHLYKPDMVLIEDAGTGKSLWQEFRSTREFPLIMWSATQDKESRLIGVTGLMESGLCRLPREAPWLDAYVEEMRGFPYSRKYDQVDSTTQFLEYHLWRGEDLLEERDEMGRKLWIKRPTLVRPDD